MFSRIDHIECDNRAKEKFKNLFENCNKYKNFYLIAPNNPYTVDFYVFSKKSNTHVANIEIEVKRVWTGFDFPFKDIQILGRKEKFWTDPAHHKEKPTMLVMFNEDLSNHLVVKSHVMKSLFMNAGTKTRNYSTISSRGDEFLILNSRLVVFSEFNENNKEPLIDIL
jgi:hypothetical protein